MEWSRRNGPRRLRVPDDDDDDDESFNVTSDAYSDFPICNLLLF